MKKEKFLKLVFLAISIIALGLAAYLSIRWFVPKKVKKAYVPKMDVTILNDAIDWETCCNENPYRLPFTKMKSVGFATDKESLYIKINLFGKLPDRDQGLPKYEGDKLTGLVFYLNFDTNYFDGQGNVNPGGPDANIEISFYGGKLAKSDPERITVDGHLVAGGPGYDYIVAKYPYKQLMFNQTQPLVIFDASALAVSKKFPAGANYSVFRNNELAVDPQDTDKIKIVLRLKTK